VYPTVVDTGAEIRCLRRPGPASQHADVPARDGEPAGRPPGGCTHVDTKTANWHPSRPVRPGSAGAPISVWSIDTGSRSASRRAHRSGNQDPKNCRSDGRTV